MTKYIKNPLLRFLYSFFVQMPLLLWYKVFAYPLPQNTLPAQYVAEWQAAAQRLATTQFSLSAYGSVPHAPDKRALTVLPYGVTVISVPDTPVKILATMNPAWATHPEPSGAIVQLSGFDYTAVHAFTLVGRHARIYSAASELPAVLDWEFENIILARLGYDVSER